MWDLVVGDKDMKWFGDALTGGTAMMVANGSYACNLDPHLSGTGWVVVCTCTKKMLKGTFYEQSLTASACRGELLGMVALHALVATAAEVYDLHCNQGSVHCDNMGALGKAREHRKRVKSSLRQGDLVRALRAMKQGLFLQLQYRYVKSHQDDVTSWTNLPLDQQLNVLCDTLAKQAVGRGLSMEAVSRRMEPLTLPFEQASIVVGGNKLTSDMGEPIRYLLGHIEARRFYTQPKDIQDNGVNTGGLGWSEEQFDLVDWENLNDSLRRKPDMFRIWLSKQCMGVNAMRRNVARIDKTDDDICPNCKLVRERSDHLNKCTDIGRTALFDESVSKLESWMGRKQTEPELAFWIGRTLRLRGSLQGIMWDKMSEAVRGVIEDVFRIGWVEFLHGKIPQSMTSLQGSYCTSFQSDHGLSGKKSWARSFIHQLNQVSHGQWLYRNFTLRHRTRGYLATKARLDILNQMAALAEVRTTDIPENSRFLLEISFKGLVLSKLDRQVYWVAAMHAALKAGRKEKDRTWKRVGRTPGSIATRSTRGVELSTFRQAHWGQSLFFVNRSKCRKATEDLGTQEKGAKRMKVSSGNGGCLP